MVVTHVGPREHDFCDLVLQFVLPAWFRPGDGPRSKFNSLALINVTEGLGVDVRRGALPDLESSFPQREKDHCCPAYKEYAGAQS